MARKPPKKTIRKKPELRRDRVQRLEQVAWSLIVAGIPLESVFPAMRDTADEVSEGASSGESGTARPGPEDPGDSEPVRLEGRDPIEDPER